MTNQEYVKTLTNKQFTVLLEEFQKDPSPEATWMTKTFCNNCYGENKDTTICDENKPCPYFENQLTETIIMEWLKQPQTFIINDSDEYEELNNENNSN